MADSNDKQQVFEEEGQRDDKGKSEETNSTSMRGMDEPSEAEPTKNRPPRAAEPRRLTGDDDDSSVGSSSSEASASSNSSEHSQSSSSSCSSTISLPPGCLRGIHDKPGGCDEAELRAREERCMEIMRLSQQVKKAERARAKAANIKPLTWAEPTFKCGPTAADVNAASKLLGKRKEHPDQDQDSSSSTTRRNPSPSHLELMHGQVFYKPNINQVKKRLNGLSSL